ncbi:MAG: helix-turn-helix protein [Dehalococcoidia bacterium]|nr:helix-turn-helix protein [Dehalococcoidia bacterium]
MAHTGDGRWLSLGRACEILGVNETTLRHWANTERIRTFRTPGGHRRFSREDLNALTQGPAKAATDASNGSAPPSALERIRRRIGRSKGGHDRWLQYFDDEGRARMRVLGRRLVTLAVEYPSRRRRRADLQEEARHLGIDYGRELASRNVGLADAVSAFIFFRNSLHGAVGNSTETGEKGNVLLSILEVEDLVLLGMATVYEGLLPANSALFPQKAG